MWQSGARTKLNKQLRNIYTDTRRSEFVRNQNRIKGQKVHKTRRVGGGSGQGARTTFWACFHVAWTDFHTPRRISLVHASSKHNHGPKSEGFENSGNNNKQQIALYTVSPSLVEQQQLFHLFNFQAGSDGDAAGTRRLERIEGLETLLGVAF